MTTTTHRSGAVPPPAASVTGGGVPPGPAVTFPDILDAAENANWNGLHALHRLYAKDTGAAQIDNATRIPEPEADAAIAWGRRKIMEQMQ